MRVLSAVLVALSLAVAYPVAQSTTPDIVGDWEITTSSPLGEQTNTTAISKTADGYKAMVKSERGTLPYDSITVSGKEITLVLTIQYESAPMMITYVGTIDEKRMGGGADFGGLAQGSWSAVRKPAADK